MMENTVKKPYLQPVVAVQQFSSEPLLIVSGDTSDYENSAGRDDVNYESRRRGWNCENWISTEED